MLPWCRLYRVFGALLLAAATRAQDGEAAPAPPSDPFAPLGREALLRDVDFSTDRRCEPVAVALQVPAGDRARKVQWLLGWWARTLSQTFDHVYAEPAGVTPRAGREQLLVVAISDRQLFESLRADLGVSDMRDEQAFFAPRLPGVVLLDPGGTDESREMQAVVRPMLHAATHALIDARLPPDAPAPPAWLVEGLAERLSAHGAKPGTQDLIVGTQDEEALTALARAFVQRPERVAMVRTLPELVAVDTLAGMEQRAADAGVAAHDVLHGLAHESSLFLAWLDESVHKQPDRSVPIVGAVLTGQACAPALSVALGGAEPAAVEADFVVWLKRQMKGVVRGVPFDQFTLQPPALEAGELRPGLRAQARHLVVAAGEPAMDRARALQLASQGGLRAAAAQLEALAAVPGLPAADVTGLGEERRLCLAVDDLRSRWLAGRVGKSVDLLDDGAVVKLNLVGVAGDALVVRDKKAQRQVPVSACLPESVAAQYLAPGTTLSPADDEARAFAWLLASDLEWRAKTAPRLRKDASAAAAKVLALQPALDERLALGRALTALDVLAARTPPGADATDAERDAWLASARGVAAARTLPVVADRLPVLRALAGQVLAGRFDAAPLRWAPPHAKVEDLGANRVRVTWDFSDPAQADDWLPVPTRGEDDGHDAPVHALSGADGLAVRDGGLELAGTGTWTASLAFAAPMNVEYEAKVGQPLVVKSLSEDRPDLGPMEFGLRLCADDAGSYLFCFGFGTLYARDALRVLEQQQQSPYMRFYLGAPYHVRLEHDGQRLRALVEGKEAASVPVLERTQGRLELWCHSEATVRLEQLVVEAAIDPAGIAPRRDAWVSDQLAALGLAEADVPSATGAR